MLLIYLLEDNPTYSSRVQSALVQSLRRNDLLITTWLAVGEVVAGAEKAQNASDARTLRNAVEKLPFTKLAFDGQSCQTFGLLRAHKVGVADSIHLACAATTGVDLFLTNDRALHKLHVPGIKFIAGLDSDWL